jgi:transposase
MVAMSDNDFLYKLLGIEKLRITQSDFIGEEQLHLSVESSLAVATCPDCGQISGQVHDFSEEQMIRDLPIAERRCYLGYRAKRFECQHCRKTFVERVAWKRLGVNYTLRYEKHVYHRARKEANTQVAEDEGLSEEAVQAIFEYWAKKRSRHVGTRKSN